MMVFEWWYWAVIGVALMLLELALPALVFVWFGLSAFIVSLLVFIDPRVSFFVEVLVWIVCSTLLVVLWFRLFRPHQHKTLVGRASAEAIGEVGLLIDPVAPFRKSKVRFQIPLFGSDVWECVSDEEIAGGERVKVVSVDGSILKIAKTGSQQ